VSIERTYYCDGPENHDIPSDPPQPNGCPKNVKALVIDPDYLPGGVLRVQRHIQGSHNEELHFCSWDCLLRYAAKQTPTQYIDGSLDE
jgi:hypothetical protein